MNLNFNSNFSGDEIPLSKQDIVCLCPIKGSPGLYELEVGNKVVETGGTH